MEHPFLDHQGSKTPEPIDMKLNLDDYVGDITPYANFGVSTLKGVMVHIREIVIRDYFLPPPLLLFYFFAHLHRSHHLTDFHGLCPKI